MDRQTLINYGWIVICALVLAVMMAFATPFGAYAMDAVTSIADGFINTGHTALTDEEHKQEIITNWEDKWLKNDEPPVEEPVMDVVIIDSVEYQYEAGMTWGEWLESDYNTSTFSLGPNNKIVNGNADVGLRYGTLWVRTIFDDGKMHYRFAEYVYASHEIIKGEKYAFSSIGVSDSTGVPFIDYFYCGDNDGKVIYEQIKYPAP